MLGRRGFLAMAAVLLVPVKLRAERYVEPEEAARLLFPGADEAKRFDQPLSKEDLTTIKKNSGMRVRNPRAEGFEMVKAGETLGWVYIDNVIGKHEYITYAAAIGPDDRVHGVEIVEYRETWGFEVRNAAWRDQFKGKSVGNPVKLGKDIDNITGATLSCRNVTDGVRRLLATHAVLGR